MAQVQARPKRSDVRAEILRAAATAFQAKGYRATTLADIADAAGFTKGAIYSNFGGKQALFGAVLAEHLTDVADTAISEVDQLIGKGDAHQVAADLAASLADEVTRQAIWTAATAEFRTLAVHDHIAKELYAELRIKQRDALADRLRERSDRLRLKPNVDLDVAANLITTTINTFALEYGAAPEAMPRELIERSLKHLLSGLLK